MGRLAELQKNLLTQLMGAEAMGIITTDVSMWDPKVCRPFVTGICPHDLFTNTKMDLGSCSRTHSVKVKTEYGVLFAKAEAESDAQTVAELNRLRVEYENTILGFVDECDRRIRAAQRRLEKTPEENNRTTALMREIGEIEGAYQAAMADVELLGSEGKVDESMSQLTRANLLKSEKVEKERELQQLTENSGASGHQKLRVCDVCGAYLSILDSDRRLADHFSGKLHLGYYQLREMMKEWRERGALVVASKAPEVKVIRKVEQKVEEIVHKEVKGFRPIPVDKLIKSNATSINTNGGPPPTAPSGPGRSAAAVVTPSAGVDRDQRSGGDRDHRTSGGDRDRNDRDRDRSDRDRPSRRIEDDRDRERSSRRSGEDSHSHSHRSSRYSKEDGEERERETREERDERREKRRHEEERRGGGERSSRSARDREEGEGDHKRRERRDNRDQEQEEGEEREDRTSEKDKRRRVD